MNLRVLVVDDDKTMASFLVKILMAESFKCDVSHAGQEALEIMKANRNRNYRYDIIILDWNLPDMDGGDFIVYAKCLKFDMPIVVLSSSTSPYNKITAFECGGDEYIPKESWNKREFIARIRAILRRCYGVHSKFRLGNMVLDFHMQVCMMNGQIVPLTNKEYAMLELLCLHGPGSIVSKEKFISHLYSNNEPSEPKIIDVFACKLRSKLALLNQGVSYIETVWGRGYTLNENSAPLKINKIKRGDGMGEEYIAEEDEILHAEHAENMNKKRKSLGKTPASDDDMLYDQEENA